MGGHYIYTNDCGYIYKHYECERCFRKHKFLDSYKILIGNECRGCGGSSFNIVCSCKFIIHYICKWCKYNRLMSEEEFNNYLDYYIEIGVETELQNILDIHTNYVNIYEDYYCGEIYKNRKIDKYIENTIQLQLDKEIELDEDYKDKYFLEYGKEEKITFGRLYRNKLIKELDKHDLYKLRYSKAFYSCKRYYIIYLVDLFLKETGLLVFSNQTQENQE